MSDSMQKATNEGRRLGAIFALASATAGGLLANLVHAYPLIGITSGAFAGARITPLIMDMLDKKPGYREGPFGMNENPLRLVLRHDAARTFSRATAAVVIAGSVVTTLLSPENNRPEHRKPEYDSQPAPIPQTLQGPIRGMPMDMTPR